MNKLQEAISRLNGPEEDVVLLQTLVRGSFLFCKHMGSFQAMWEDGNYTKGEQRHVVRLTRAYAEFYRALDSVSGDPMLWLGVLALGKFTRAGDVFLRPAGFEMIMVHGGSDNNPLNQCPTIHMAGDPLWPPDAKWCDLCGCYMSPVEDSTRLECSNAFCDSHKERG